MSPKQQGFYWPNAKPPAVITFCFFVCLLLSFIKPLKSTRKVKLVFHSQDLPEETCREPWLISASSVCRSAQDKRLPVPPGSAGPARRAGVQPRGRTVPPPLLERPLLGEAPSRSSHTAVGAPCPARVPEMPGRILLACCTVLSGEKRSSFSYQFLQGWSLPG